ncbi:DUF1848 domain-containing protein [Gilliamella sp. W8145]|uniref:DUF1848 domain-containing protein n=1 Tax=Gilliamella sp. W8145 TaxID=2750990 RepID=UPI0018DD1862|nr:DUF1848 domain-containing protein [Gilliamella sp. W8145]MBI0103260.1 DUF1848 domain-containing protein [Gilliamella sp. W8145]
MIISASRRTDIPAFYSSWFFNRLKDGFVLVPNPRNSKQLSRIFLSPDIVDCIVFWTKNPSSMLHKLVKLSEYPFYFQFTLTAYEADIEKHLPALQKRIAIFKQLAEQVGQDRVIWRYDPILINKHYTIDYHIDFFNQIASSLRGYTDSCIISFIDDYPHIQQSLIKEDINRLQVVDILNLCSSLSEIASDNQLTLQTCAEEIELLNCNISHGACIDKTRIEKITGRLLLAKKDKNQRNNCQCLESIDIGTYDTCPFGCLYCYATTSKRKVQANKRLYNQCSPKLVGDLLETDIIKDKPMRSLFSLQNELF